MRACVCASNLYVSVVRDGRWNRRVNHTLLRVVVDLSIQVFIILRNRIGDKLLSRNIYVHMSLM